MNLFKRCLVLTLCFLMALFMFSCNSASTDVNNSKDTSKENSIENSVFPEESSFDSSSADTDVTEDVSYNDNSGISEDGSDDVSYEDPTTDVSVEDSGDIDSEDTTIDVSEDELPDGSRFSTVAPLMEMNKVWESGKMELYNTDFRISDELAKKLEKQFASFANPQSIALIEMDTDMAFFYDKDAKIATASSIKGPMALFAYKCIDDGIINWDTVKTYQAWHFQANSTGWVQNSPFGTGFSVKTLMDYMVRISDNQAYLMIKELVGVENFERMMSVLGSSRVIPQGSNWGYISAFEMASVWREVYHYSLSSESGAELFDRFMHAQYNYIWRAIPQYEAAHKSGWSGKAYNDAGVVFADGHQYVLVGLYGRSGLEDPRSQYQFNAVARLLAEVMVEYNAYLDEGAGDVSSESSLGEE